MARIFVSSTFKDLEECREKVRIVLRRMDHEDVAMEYFVAEDKRSVEKCLEDVESCDLYIGIFAWRYGYVPDGCDKSITELEYRKAVKARKKCLIFLLHEDASWPRKFVDKGKDAERIETLRNELSHKYVISYFQSSDELASLVGASVYKWRIKTTKLSPEEEKITEPNLKQYKKAVSTRYRNIDLDTLTPSKKEDYLKIQLSSVFVEQSVRENPPPVELPKEIWSKIHEEWDPQKECFPECLTPEDLKHAKEFYYSKDPKAVLDVICEERNKYIVILGDPGSGKSTLTKYILLSILQVNHDEKLSGIYDSYLPLRVEMREFAGLYANKKCETFLDYFQYLSKTEGYSLTKKDLINYLKNNGKSIVIFDGLDEIFDPKEWERINHMIVGFTLDYPKIRIIVTSRIVGYKRKILDDAGFAHYTLQDFEKEQIGTFLDRWYPLVVDDKEIESRKSRILKALKDSHSIRQLAGNPLLLTILAIIGKHQELPKERWKLYDHAASVLVENWEVNKHLKRNNGNIEFIGEDDKKELLMKIAFKMQSSPKGLSGNFIHRKTLQQEIEIYLITRYQKNPSDAKLITESIINQFREVNFILSLYGANFYGFVHRTFLEYFCALDIVQKFDNHEINIETLISNYYKNYWEDPSWHEVLSLICGMKEKFAVEIIEFLLKVYDPQYFGDRPPLNISLAIKCLSELRNPNAIGDTAKKLLERVLKLFEMVRWTEDINQFLTEEIIPAVKLVSKWPHQDIIIEKFSRSQIFLDSRSQIYMDYSFTYPKIDLNLNNTWAEFIMGLNSRSEELYKKAIMRLNQKEYSDLLSILILGKYESKDKFLFTLFSNISSKSRFHFIREAAIRELARGWHDDPGTLKVIKKSALEDEKKYVRSTAIKELAHGWHDDPETLKIIKKIALEDEEGYVRSTAVHELSCYWHDDSKILRIIKQLAIQDENSSVRRSAVQELVRGWHDDPETLKIIKKRAIKDEDNDVRMTAVQELARGWHDDPKTLNVIKRWATNNDNFAVRISALQELAYGWHDDPETFQIINNKVMEDKEGFVRSAAVQELAHGWHDDPETLINIKHWAINQEIDTRISAVHELACGWHDDPETLQIIKMMVKENGNFAFRLNAIKELARGWHDNPDTFLIIKEMAKQDVEGYVRSIAIEELARGWHDNPDTFLIIKQLATQDEDNFVRNIAVQELSRCWYDNLETLQIIKNVAKKDKNYTVRKSSIQELARCWHDDPETFKIIKRCALKDNNYAVRMSAVQELPRGWHDDPNTFKIIKKLAMYEQDYAVWCVAVQELAHGWHDNPETFKIIKELASADIPYAVRCTAVQVLALGWHDDSETFKIVKQWATEDDNSSVRSVAVQELALGWHDNPETFEIIKKQAIEDKNKSVRRSAVKELARGWYDYSETLQIIKKIASDDKSSSVKRRAVKELACFWHDDPEALKIIKNVKQLDTE